MVDARQPGNNAEIAHEGNERAAIWTGLTPLKGLVTNPDIFYSLRLCVSTILTWSRYQTFSRLKYLIEISSFPLNIYLVSIVDTADLFQVFFSLEIEGY